MLLINEMQMGIPHVCFEPWVKRLQGMKNLTESMVRRYDSLTARFCGARTILPADRVPLKTNNLQIAC